MNTARNESQLEQQPVEQRRDTCGEPDAMPMAAGTVSEEERKSRVRAAAEQALVVHEQTFRRLADS